MPPTGEDLPDRLHAVRHVLHLILTAGHTATAGTDLMDVALASEGIRLTERLHRALPEDPETTGLLALMLLSHACAEARRVEDTDWLQITELYRMLAAAAPSPVVSLNLAAAIGMADGPDAGLAALAPLLADPSLARTHRLHAAHAHLLAAAGRSAEAREAFARAAPLTTSIPEQRYLNARGRHGRSVE